MTARLCALFAATFGVALSPAATVAAAGAPSVVNAGGQTCIATRSVTSGTGLTKSVSNVFSNSCRTLVKFWGCDEERMQPSAHAPCDPRYSSYGAMALQPGASMALGGVFGATHYLVVHECPTGYGPYTGFNGVLTCRLGG